MNWFKTKETDLVNMAHTLALGAISVFDDIVTDLTHANEMLVEARMDSLDHVAHHSARANDAAAAHDKNNAVIKRIAAITS